MYGYTCNDAYTYRQPMPKVQVTKEFRFEAAHFLPDHAGVCAHLHGHSYVLEVTVGGPVGSDGMVVDFADLGAVVRGLVVDDLDHTLLNDRWENPTAERAALAIWEILEKRLPTLASLTLRETASNRVTVTA